nr:DEAD-box ATP-dependent RNA helicase 42 [Tanacetum cinerariifolium]
EWQEKRRKKESKKENADSETAGKTWTLDGESDDEEALPVENTDDHMDVDGDVKENKENGDGMVNGLDNGDTVTSVQNGDVMGEDEIDPLDAFMNTMAEKDSGRSLGRIIPGEDSNLEYPNLDHDEDPLEDEDDPVSLRIPTPAEAKLAPSNFLLYGLKYGDVASSLMA